MILALAVVSYLWLCTAWFDHDLRLGFLSETPPAIPARLFIV
jgi:hypothetical protein